MHQACCYGSDRPKWTCLAHNGTAFNAICKTCPGQSETHVHRPWGLVEGNKFATAQETAYPPMLAFTIAHCFATELANRGWMSPAPTSMVTPNNVSYHYLRSVTGVQPKASKLPPLVSEFAELRTVSGVQFSCCPIQPGDKLSTPWNGLPTGACLLKKPPLRSNKGEGVEINA